MIIKKFDNEEEWLVARNGKITGTRLKDIIVLRGTNEKKAFYELIAERLAINRPDGEDKMTRGHILEPEAVELCEKEIKKTFNKDLVIWQREDNESIAMSPDAFTEDLKEAIEVKCLNSADHIKAVILGVYPEDYEYQIYQYFIVNDKLKTLHFVMYDPSLSVHQYIRFEIKRKDIQEKIDQLLEYEQKKLREINEIITKLSF